MTINWLADRTNSWFTLLLLFLVTGFGISPATAATVEPGIRLISENETIYMGDSVIIDVEAVGLLEPLDVSSLFKFADLLRETTGTRIAVIDGRVIEVKLRRMEFVPKQEGRVFFGPLNGESVRGAVASNTLIIDVQPPADINWEADANDLQISMVLGLGSSALDTVANNQPYVGQHMVASIELRHRHPIFEEKLTLPSFEGFDVLPEYEERRTIENSADDDSWRVISWRYHLFPQRSGKQSITGISWSGTAVRSRTQRSKFARDTTEISYAIKPAADFEQWWLPATAVILSDEWSKDPRELSAGDEIIRTISLKSEGVLANHLPTVIPLESRALTSTLINQSRNQELSNGSVKATATFTYRMVAQSPIPVFLDTVRVPWFHTLENTPREAIIPARRINVGLPDRADLLADIALKDNWGARLKFKISSSEIQRAPWYISFSMLVIVCSALGFRELFHSRREFKQYSDGHGAGNLPEL